MDKFLRLCNQEFVMSTLSKENMICLIFLSKMIRYSIRLMYKQWIILYLFCIILQISVNPKVTHLDMGMENCLIFELEISPTNFEWRGTRHFCP